MSALPTSTRPVAPCYRWRHSVMRYAGPALFLAVFAAAALAPACAGEPRDDFEARPDAAALDPGEAGGPVATCGDADDLPPGVTRDDAAHEVRVPSSSGTASLTLTVLDDGIVRLRYGDGTRTPVEEERRGSIVALDRPAAKAPLVTGRRGRTAIVCTRELEIAIDPVRTAVTAKDLATGAVILDDADGGFFRARATASGAAAKDGERDVLGVVRVSPPGERIYGLGLHTAAQAGAGLDLRGSVVELYNTDAFDPGAGGFRPDAPSLYESIPFYVGLRGKTAYGVFTDNTHRLRFDIAKTEPSRLRTTAWGGTIDQYLVAGPSMKEVVRRYTLLTGRAPVPAPWALGFHQSRWEGPCDGSPASAERHFCSASQILSFADTLRERGVPADGVFLDIQHMEGFRSFTFDGARFEDPEALFAALAARGLHASAIIDPGIKVDEAWQIYASGLAGGHFLGSPGDPKKPFVGEVWPGPSVFPDFSRDATRTWWGDLVRGLAARGVSGAWIDMNEPASFTTGTVPDLVPADGDGRATTMAEVHNAYGLFEAKATYEGLLRARPGERPFVLSRAAFAGQQRWSAVWTGDAPSTWTTLGMTLPQLLHLGVSGIPFAGSDVGGYSGRDESTPELFARWMSLGAISPFFRAHAEKDARRQEPWAFGDDTLDATRSLIRLRYELMPYLYSVFDESSRTGAPVLRPLVFEDQDDESVADVADEATLGAWLLVAPVLSKEAAKARAVVLPKGRWFDYRSGAVFDGGKTVTTSAAPDTLPPDALPVFAREGAIIPRVEAGSNVAAARGGALFLDAFPGAARTTFTLREDDGTTSAAVSRVTFATQRTATGARFEALAREGSYAAPHARIVVRLRRVDRDPSSVTLGGVALPRAPAASIGAASMPVGSFGWDANDRAVVVALPDRFPFSLDLVFDPTLVADGDVDVPVRVSLPPSTPMTTEIHVASSRAGWLHAPLVRAGDVATGTIRLPRGGWGSFKISRGGWPTVEKGAGCAEIDNRRAFGAATRTVAVNVVAWADRCR